MNCIPACSCPENNNIVIIIIVIILVSADKPFYET